MICLWDEIKDGAMNNLPQQFVNFRGSVCFCSGFVTLVKRLRPEVIRDVL